MMSYILFPIGIYYYLNQGESIEEWVQNEKKKFEPMSKEQHADLMNFIEECNKKRQLKRIIEIEAQYKD